MIAELLIFPCVVAGGVGLKMWAKDRKKMDDGKVIREIFENRKVGFMKGKGKNAYVQYPSLIKKIENEKRPYDVRIYKIPNGLPFEMFAQLKPALTEALGREVVMEFDGRCVIMKLAKKNLGNKIPLKPLLGKTKGWNVLVGLNQFEVVTHDFDAYPHLVGGGATRFGKTVLMKNFMTQLMLQKQENVRFWIIDLKGGVEFWEYENLKQIRRVTAKPLDAYFLLQDLNHRLDLRMKYFKRKGFKNIVDTPIKQRDFVIIDESHDLFATEDKAIDAKKAKNIKYFASRLASMGGAFGFRMLTFTQYPVKEAIPQFVKQNAPVRISFQVADDVASRVILDQTGAADLPGIPGRCIVKSFRFQTVQVPYEEDYMKLVQQFEVKKKVKTSEASGEGRKHIVDFG